MLSTIARLATYIGTCLAVPVLRRKMPRDARARSAFPAVPSSRSRRWSFACCSSRPPRRRISSAAPSRSRWAPLVYVSRRRTRPRSRHEGERDEEVSSWRPSRSAPPASARRRRLADAGVPTPPPVTAIRAARMFDGRSDTTIANAVVVVEGAKISAVGRRPGRAGRARRSIDLGDATLLPGFIDSHTHLTGEAGDSYVQDFFDGPAAARRPSRRSTARGLREARPSRPASRRCATSAPTDDLDVGLRNAINEGLTPGPAHARRALRARRDRRPLRQHRVSRRTRSARSPASRRASSTAPNEGRQAVRLRHQVRRRRDQDVRLGRRALARRRRLGAAADRRGAHGDHRRGAPAEAQDRGARPRRPRRARRRSRPASTRSSTARS